MSMIRIAAVQATPVFLDREATVDKTCSLVDKAAGDGAELVVLAESFIPTYPDWVWRTRPWDEHATALWERLVDQAVVVGSESTARLAEAARRNNVLLSIGVTERDEHGTSLYNTALLFDADGHLVHHHRKIKPTGGERLVWGEGDGSSLHAVDTAVGRIGTLICWESLMPLARTALYRDGIDLYLAPTWDSSAAWVASLRHIAREGGVHVVGVNTCMRARDVADDIPGRDALYGDPDDWMSPGNTTIVGPDGEVIAGPLIGEEGMLVADLDLTANQRARQHFDATGHYARNDIFELRVNRPVTAI
jgi:nitrilase